MYFVHITLWILALVDFSICDTKTWRYNTDVTDQRNWNKEEEDEECEGLIFPSMITFAALPDMEVKQIVFPKNGELVLNDNIEIRFDNDTKEKVNCAFLNNTMFNTMYWSDVNGWASKEFKDLEAVPHVERVPCQYDDVVLPRGISTSTLNLNYVTYRIKSFTFGNDSWTNDDLPDYSKSKVIEKILQGYSSLSESLLIKAEDCKDPTGCICGNEDSMACWLLPYNSDPKYACLNPLQPVGFCDNICGAYILFKPIRKTFRIDSMKKTLEAYESLTHVSKVVQNEIEFIQIIFTEKTFEGTSIDDAEDLYRSLLEDSSFGAKKVKLFSAHRQAESSAGMIFGIIFGIALGCLVALLVYSPRSREVLLNSAISLRERLDRLDLSHRQVSFTTHFLARYRRSEDCGLFEEASGSVISLERSFENPLHEVPSPSTSSTSCDTNEEKTKSKTEFENPLFEEHKGVEMVKVGEDGELVDLTN